MGKEKEARAEAAEVLRINPKFSVDYFVRAIAYKDQSQTVNSGTPCARPGGSEVWEVRDLPSDRKKGLTIFFVFINIPDGRYSLIRGKEIFFLRRRRKGGDTTGGRRNENHSRPGDRALRDAGHRDCDSSDFQTEKRKKAAEGSEKSFVGQP